MINSIYAYMDEYGTPIMSIEKDGTSKYFIVVAVTAIETDIENLRAGICAIQKKYFHGNNMKSSNIGNNHERRTAVLSDIMSLGGFKYHALIVDKNLLERTGGLIYKGSFYKFFNRKIYAHIVENTTNAHFVADKYSRPDFMDGFKTYLHERLYDGALFALRGEPDISFNDSEIEPLLSLPDIIAGTWGKIIEGHGIPAAYKTQWERALISKALWLQPWPPSISAVNYFAPDGQYDEDIRKLSITKAYQFIDAHISSSDEKEQMQIDVLEFLLFQQIFVNNDLPVFSHKIVEHLARLGYEGINTDILRYDAIVPLRNAGVLITSNRKGYKISVTEKDIRDFIEYSQTYILPLVSRVKTATDIVDSATNGNLHLLDSYPDLKRFLSVAPHTYGVVDSREA